MVHVTSKYFAECAPGLNSLIIEGKGCVVTLYTCFPLGMLNDDDVRKKDSAVKCLEVMSTSDPNHWCSILEAGRKYTILAIPL